MDVVDGFAFEWTLFWNELIKVKFNSPEADAVFVCLGTREKWNYRLKDGHR